MAGEQQEPRLHCSPTVRVWEVLCTRTAVSLPSKGRRAEAVVPVQSFWNTRAPILAGLRVTGPIREMPVNSLAISPEM